MPSLLESEVEDKVEGREKQPERGRGSVFGVQHESQMGTSSSPHKREHRVLGRSLIPRPGA